MPWEDFPISGLTGTSAFLQLAHFASSLNTEVRYVAFLSNTGQEASGVVRSASLEVSRRGWITT